MYRINELFVNIQGEGPSVGYPAVFVRFAGCNLACDFCDTEHDKRVVNMSHERLLQEIDEKLHEAKWCERDRFYVRCIFTGGEPLLQLGGGTVAELYGPRDMAVHLETNGTRKAMEKFKETNMEGWWEVMSKMKEIVISPKSIDVDPDLVRMATCLKVLSPLQGDIDTGFIHTLVEQLGEQRKDAFASSFIVQPVTPKGQHLYTDEWRENCQGAVETAKALTAMTDVPWRVIPQTHVMMGLR